MSEGQSAFRRLHDYVRGIEWRPLAASALMLALGLLILAPLRGSYQPNENPGTHEAQQEASDAGETSDDRLAAYTLWLTIFTGVLAFGTLALWYVTDQTLRHAREDSARQAQDTALSIAISKQAADAALAANRAWVSVSAHIVGPFTFGPEHVHLPVDVTLKNVGRSPATNIYVSEALELEPAEPREPVDALEMAVAKSTINYGNKRSTRYLVEEDTALAAAERKIGVTLFPDEERRIDSTVWLLKRADLDEVIANGGGSTLVFAYLATTADYRAGGDLCETTVTFAVERRIREAGEEGYWLFDSTKQYPPIQLGLRPLSVFNSAN